MKKNKKKIDPQRYTTVPMPTNSKKFLVIDTHAKAGKDNVVGDTGGYEKRIQAQVLVDYLNAAQTAPKKVVFEKGRGVGLGYRSEDHLVHLPDHDTDIRLVTPHGEEYMFQWRVENQSVDICLGKGPESLLKMVYLDRNDGKGKVHQGKLADQITIL